MVLEAMEVHKDDAAHALSFHVNLLAPSMLDQLRVVLVLEQRFAGERGDVGRFWRATGKPFGSIVLKFPDADRYRDAVAFCDSKLTKSGMAVAVERPNLDVVDPGSRSAGAMLRAMYDRPVLDAIAAH